MKFQVVKVEGDSKEIAPNGSDLSMSEAETLLDELRRIEICYVNSRVTPIITLWKSTKLGAFAVSRNGKHYQYKIMRDVFSEMSSFFSPVNYQLN